MEPVKKKTKVSDDPGENCRLLHGLNIHCLVHILQHLGTGDLYILGGMNEFFEQIINDFVILKHNVNIFEIRKSNATLNEFFKRHGPKIRQIHNIKLSNPVIELITKYCSVNQLKSVECFLNYGDIVLPIQFRSVERFKFESYIFGGHSRLSVPFSESLRHLDLYNTELHPDFDWTQLMNLTELHLNFVIGINVKNFIEFIRRRPKLERFFQHYTFNESMQEIGEAMTKYCGNQIQVFFDENDSEEAMNPNFYKFLSEMNNLKKVGFSTRYRCGSDLIHGIQWLAEKGAIEQLVIETSSFHETTVYCPLMKESTGYNLYMKRFPNLKTIQINAYITDVGHRVACERMQLLLNYSAEILSNVETIKLMIESRIYDWEFIKSVPKLRELYIIPRKIFDIYGGPTDREAAKIVSNLKSILKKRKTEENNCKDFIELKVDESYFEIFRHIDDIDDSIKLIKFEYRLILEQFDDN